MGIPLFLLKQPCGCTLLIYDEIQFQLDLASIILFVNVANLKVIMNAIIRMKKGRMTPKMRQLRTIDNKAWRSNNVFILLLRENYNHFSVR